MPSITIERKSVTYHADGSTTVSFTKATYDWPMSVISSFRHMHPHVPVTVDLNGVPEPSRATYKRKARDYGSQSAMKRETHHRAPEAAPASSGGISTSDLINEAVIEVL